MSESDRIRWDARYADRKPTAPAPVDTWLRDNILSVPPGKALDLACGLGHNALWLAEQGWKVDAVDISPLGLQAATSIASERGVSVNWIVADLDEYTPEATAYDLVTVFRFVDRARLPDLIVAALQPGGLLVYEAFHTGQLARPDNHLRNAAFALEPGELPRLFPSCDVLQYSECDLADRSVARLFARKRLV